MAVPLNMWNNPKPQSAVAPQGAVQPAFDPNALLQLALAGGAGAPSVADIIRGVANPQSGARAPSGVNAGYPGVGSLGPGNWGRPQADTRFGTPAMPGQQDPRFGGGGMGGGAAGMGVGTATRAVVPGQGTTPTAPQTTTPPATTYTAPQSAPHVATVPTSGDPNVTPAVIPTTPTVAPQIQPGDPGYVAPTSGAKPGEGTVPHGYFFTNDDIVAAAYDVNPEFAAKLGFGLPGSLEDPFGNKQDFFQYFGEKLGIPGWETMDAKTFRHYFATAGIDFEDLYAFAEDNDLDVKDVVLFMDQLSNRLDLLDEEIYAEQNPAKLPTPTEDQLAPYRRPLSEQEILLNATQEAGLTGRTDPTAEQQDVLRGQRDMLARGDGGHISDIVGGVREAETANPGSYLYGASRGELPSTISHDITERVLMAMGNIGQRYGAGTAGTIGRGISDVTQARALEAQGLLGQLSTQTATIAAQREKDAQMAFWEDYIRNSPLTPREKADLTLELIGLGTGGGTTTVTGGGDNNAGLLNAIGQLGSGVGSIAGSWSTPTTNFNRLSNATGGLTAPNASGYSFDPFSGRYRF